MKHHFLHGTPKETVAASWCKGIDFFSYSEEIKEKTVTAVFSIIKNEDKILLVFNPERNRWELPGGHLSLDEYKNQDTEAAMLRETEEEANMIPLSYQPILIAKVTNSKKTINKETGIPYPRIAHMIYYVVTSYKELEGELKHEITKKEWFSLEMAEQLINETNSAALRAFHFFEDK